MTKDNKRSNTIRTINAILTVLQLVEAQNYGHGAKHSNPSYDSTPTVGTTSTYAAPKELKA